MTLYTRDAIASQIHRLLNAAFQWTEKDQCAVATLLRPHVIVVNINGQEFSMTVQPVPKK